MPPRGEQELRCFCSRRTLLAVCGRDTKTAEPYVWVKVFKSHGRSSAPVLYAQIIVTAGVVRLQCRYCERWHRVVIRRENVDFKETPLPETIAI